MITYRNLTIEKRQEDVIIVNLVDKPDYVWQSNYIEDIIRESQEMEWIYNIVYGLLSLWYSMSINPKNLLNWLRFDWKNKLVAHPIEVFLDN